MELNRIYCGNCVEVLTQFEDNTFDSVVTDPPYELGFMGKAWDKTGIAYNVEMWKEVLRVLKPGGHLLAFGGTRTYHRMACAIEDAGFDIRDQIQWIQSTGFPKSLDLSKKIDQLKGAEREKVRIPASEVRNPKSIQGGHGIEGGDRPWMQRANELGYHEMDGDIPVTPEAKQWYGWGTALKPAHEPIVLARKPRSESSAAANLLKWGTGGLYIDKCRIPVSPDDENIRDFRKHTRHTKGRFPSNVIFDEESAEMLDKQAAFIRRTKQGNVSRFFYVAKASKSERTHGGEIENKHPTVKPLKLLEYLVTLVTPPGGIVLDPFCGSGTTLLAAKQGGWRYVGIEKEPEYVELANRRLELGLKKSG